MKEEIQKYIEQSILNNEVTLQDDSKLYSGGLLSSMAHLKLINFIERTYGVMIPMSTVTLTNFDTVSQIAQFVEERLADSRAAK